MFSNSRQKGEAEVDSDDDINEDNEFWKESQKCQKTPILEPIWKEDE